MEIDILGLLLRWMHIFAAIALFGGTMFQGFALLPAVGNLPESERRPFHDAVRSRWSKVVMVSILFLLVSGLTNYILTIRTFKALGPEYELPKIYHMLFGIKFLLAMVIFFFASVLSGRSEKLQKFRDQAGKWVTLNLILATIVVGISGVLRSTHTGPNIEPPAEAVESVE